jgi:hypothetical protein
LAANPNVWSYPGLVRSLVRGPGTDGVCVTDDVCGADPENRALGEGIAEVAAEMGRLRAEGRSVQVLDAADTVYYLASGVAPGDRYCPPIATFIWDEQVARRRARLMESPPDDLLMREPSAWKDADWSDALDALHESVASRYEAVGRVGPFVHWRRHAAATPVPATRGS